MIDRQDPALLHSGGVVAGFALTQTVDAYGLIFIGALCGSIIALCGHATASRLEALKVVTKSVLLSMLLTTIAAKLVAQWLGEGWTPGELMMGTAGMIALFADLVVERIRHRIRVDGARP